jgi:hypothetical protein
VPPQLSKIEEIFGELKNDMLQRYNSLEPKVEGRNDQTVPWVTILCCAVNKWCTKFYTND